jgi:hypothetical protein
MSEASPRSSGDLRRELAALEVDLAALDGRRSTVDCQIKFYALSARRGNPAAVKGIADARAAKRAVNEEIEHATAARAQLNAEIGAALEREAAADRKRASDEALKFAAEVEPIGVVLDEAILRFRDQYLDLRRRLHAADVAGHGPSAALVQSALTQALRAVLWRITELGISSPDAGLGRSFASLTSAWSGAARGASQRLLAPPASPPRVNGANGSRPLPPQADMAERLPNDDANFAVYDDLAARDAAVRAAAAGPGRKP